MSALQACLERTMQAKKPGRPVTSDRDDVSVKIDRELKAQAEYVAARRRVPLAEYLTDLLRPMVARDFKAAQDKSN